jgi:hypothetical protein
MASIYEIVLAHLPPARKTAGGWFHFNAVCCHHQGHKADTRSRGNILLSPDGKIVYSCFNCNFAVIYDPQSLTKKFETFMLWLGVPQDDINHLRIEQLAQNINGVESTDSTDRVLIFNKNFREHALPHGSRTILDWLNDPTPSEEFLKVHDYLLSRGSAVGLDHYTYYWTPAAQWKLNERLIIPYYYRGQVVGWTARYAGTAPKGVPKYYNSEHAAGYLFNGDVLDHPSRQYCLLCEGPFDAIACSGVAAFGSKLTREQVLWLGQTRQQVIVVPDRQLNNQHLIDAALEYEWHVSFPEWEDHVKDAAQAAERYGKIYTIKTIIDNATDNALKINVMRTKFAKG